MFHFSKRSIDRLEGVHPILVQVVTEALKISKQDFFVSEGVRTKERQAELYAKGRTTEGPIVTWTMNSKHMKQADGFGHAVDLVPHPVDWGTFSKFEEIYHAMMKAALKIGVQIRWGGDWDMDGHIRERKESDLVHFELAR